VKNQTASPYHLRRIIGSEGSNGNYGDDDIENENENGIAGPPQEDEGEESLPVSLPDVSLPGRRATRFVQR